MDSQPDTGRPYPPQVVRRSGLDDSDNPTSLSLQLEDPPLILQLDSCKPPSMSMPPPSGPSKSRNKSPPLRPLGPNSLMTEITPSNLPPPAKTAPIEGSYGPVEPGVLADAINKLDTLRQKTPSTTAHTSPVASGASSPNPVGLPTSETIVQAVQDARNGPGPVTGSSQPPTAASVPGTPHFGAQTGLLKTLDESTRVIRQSAQIPTRASSVSGIGAVVEKPDYSEAKIVVAMVGLPARGKSYLSNRLMRYLRWLEYNVEVFNVGQLRRSKARSDVQAGREKADHSAMYFSHSNAAGQLAREQLAQESLESLIRWLKKEGNVGIMALDPGGKPSSASRADCRDKIRERIAKEPGLQLLFLESKCDDPAVIATNIALKVQSGDPDYAGMSREEAERDFRRRIDAYERVYETVTEPDLSFCRIMNVGERVTMNRIQGYLQSRIAFYLMNLHLKPRSIYLSRHGESMYNVEGKIGGDSDLSPRGWDYARALPDLIKKNIGEGPLEVWTSTLQRTQQTGSFLPFEKKTWKSLDELDAGVCDGMTYEEIEQKYPEDYESRDEDKFNYRYRGGESYRDVVVRLEPVIMELERQENILIIGHQAILRSLYAYFMSLSQEELPYIKIPLHTLIKITPMAYGCHEERYPLPIDAVDTHRPKPARGRKDSVAASEAGTEAPSRAPPARDYFGDTSHLAANEPAKGTKTEPTGDSKNKTEPTEDSKNPLEAVKDVLQQHVEADQLTPKAVKGA